MSEVDYVEITRSHVLVEKKFVENDGLPAKIVYYCQKCKKTVPGKRLDKKLSFKCEECGEANISFGSEESINNYYKVRPVIEE